MMERLSLKIHGIVQGVGFRPFVHKLVRDHGLRGYIRNCSSGVELELEGERSSLEKMLKELPEKAPRLSLIQDMEAKFSRELKGFTGFEIESSSREEYNNTLISPDLCICDDCLRELWDKSDRRYRYPFINCTNCGPRFTIIKDLPYDRARTSMEVFPMCPDCEREYGDIENRRYHAQPDCCEKCGPRVFYLDRDGKELAGEGIELARQRLKNGDIVAIKGLGGLPLGRRRVGTGTAAEKTAGRKALCSHVPGCGMRREALPGVSGGGEAAEELSAAHCAAEEKRTGTGVSEREQISGHYAALYPSSLSAHGEGYRHAGDDQRKCLGQADNIQKRGGPEGPAGHSRRLSAP